MNVPGWYELALLGLAAWRTWCLLASDQILDRPRRYLLNRAGGHRGSLEEFLECPYCLGFWVALGWWGAWQFWPQTVTAIATLVAVAALVPLIQRAASDD